MMTTTEKLTAELLSKVRQQNKKEKDKEYIQLPIKKRDGEKWQD